MYTQHRSQDSWKDLFRQYKEQCSETSKLRMWFIRPDAIEPRSKQAEDGAEEGDRRRLIDLSERIRRVCEFQASTEM